MKIFLLRFLFALMVGALLAGRAEADPSIAFSNIPPPTEYKVGGSTITGSSLKALLFTTPISSRVMIASVKVGLTYCNGAACFRGPSPVYPSQADFQVSIYSVRDQGGVLTPDVELYSIPMQHGLTLTGTGTEFTFDIPNWQLAANTTYALVGRSTDTNPVKWGNIQLPGCAQPCIYPPQAQNGFTFSSNSAFATPQTEPTAWTETQATNNSVEMKFLFVPTLSLANSPQTFSGSPILATVSCSSGGAVSNVLYNGSSTVPSAAGTYAITADCAASTNYSAVTGGSAGNFVISAATPTLSVTNTPQTYTGSPISAVVSCLGGGTVSNVQYSGNSTAPTNAGTYTVTANCAASTNYSAVTGGSAGNFVINPASQSINLVATPTSISVNATSTLSVTGTTGTGTVTYSKVSGPCNVAGSTVTGTGAGACVVTATIAADTNHNSATSSAVTITVSLAPQTALVVVPSSTSINVNGTSTLSTTGGNGSGAVTYAVASGPCTVTGNTLTGTGAGTCSVTATKAADSAYAATTSSPITITVAGPPPVLNLLATPGPGYIMLTFSVANAPAVASAAAPRVQSRTGVTYTGTCTSSNGGVTASATGPSSPLNVTGTTAGKSYTCIVVGTDGSGASAPSNESNAVTPLPAPTPAPIPTLSEWSQIIMMFLMIASVGFYGWRMKQH